MSNLRWKQSVSKVEPDKILLRGYRLEDLMRKVHFPSAMFLALTGRLPDPRWDRLLTAILISTIDHGVTPPSVLAALHASTGGADLSASIASGVLAMSRHHGGAIEQSMEVLYEAVRRVKEKRESEEDAAAWVVKEHGENDLRLGGYGHKIHFEDPRTRCLQEMAREAGLDLRYFTMARAIEKAIQKKKGRRVPLNVLGATAAILCAMDFPAALGNLFFIVARIPGIAAHVHEEGLRQKPLRTIHPTDNEYDGPPERTLDDED